MEPKVKEASMKAMRCFWEKHRKCILGIFVIFFAFHGNCEESKYYLPNLPSELAVGKQDVSKYQTGKPHPAIVDLPDSIAQLRQKDGEAFLVEVVRYVQRKTKDSFEQIKMFHDWIALNIEYDVPAYRGKDTRADQTLDVLKKGKAVCAGYARVFKVLCDIAGFPCREISGWGAQGGGGSHGWNRVKIEGGWYLVDVTWDAGGLTQDSKGEECFEFNYKTLYLFTKPEILIYDHYPDAYDDQLLMNPWTLNQFNSRPRYDPEFFEIVKTKPFVDSGTVEIKGTTYSVSFQVNPIYQVDVYVAVRPEEKTLSTGIAKITQTEEGHVTVTIPMHAGPGKYGVLICATREDEKVRISPDTWSYPRHEMVRFYIEFTAGD